MIVVRERVGTDRKPFDCVAFVCESRQAARNLTYALATAFQVIQFLHTCTLLNKLSNIYSINIQIILIVLTFKLIFYYVFRHIAEKYVVMDHLNLVSQLI